MPTINELQIQINQLQEHLNNLKGVPNIEIRTITAQEGYTFRRKQDGLIVGEEIALGYDYSLGFRRIDKEEFYEQVLKETQE